MITSVCSVCTYFSTCFETVTHWPLSISVLCRGLFSWIQESSRENYSLSKYIDRVKVLEKSERSGSIPGASLKARPHYHLGLDMEIPQEIKPFFVSGQPNREVFYDSDYDIDQVTLRIYETFQWNFYGKETASMSKIKISSVEIENEELKIEISLHLFPSLRLGEKKQIRNFSMVVCKESGREIALDLPKELSLNLCKYLKQGKTEAGFCCYQFVQFVHGLSLEYGTYRFLDHFEFSKYSLKDDRAGNIVLLKDYEKPVHAALSLGEDLFLWHSGPACLVVSSLEAMCKIYSSANRVLLGKRKE